jgi:hypothetical protein
MTRKTLAQFKSYFQASLRGENRGLAALAYITIAKSTTGGDGINMTVQVHEPWVEQYISVANENGKIKTYRNVDDVVKDFAKWGLFGVGRITSFETRNPELMDAKPFSGDLVAKARRDITAYTAKSAAMRLAMTSLTASIALMSNMTTAEQALIAEKTAQRESIAGTADYYDAEIVRLNAIVGGV